MASNIVNKTAFGTDTGTGQTLAPFRLYGAEALYKENSPVAQPAYLKMKAAEPKPTKDYSGVWRGTATFRREIADSNGRLWPAIVEVSSSLPAFMTDAARAAFVLEATLLQRITETQDLLSKGSVPQ